MFGFAVFDKDKNQLTFAKILWVGYHFTTIK